MAELGKYIYSCKEYNFSKIIEEIFDCSVLQKIHEKLPPHIQYKDLHKLGEDNKTWFHQKFYEPINEGCSPFQDLYEKFIAEEVSARFDFKEFLYQRSPTFRVHAPDNIAVGG